MTPKADRNRELIAARIVHERAWAYDAWMARLSYSSMRRAANLPENEGGLGYDLSESALKGLVTQARADRGDLTMSRDERIERQAAEVDERGRAARQDMNEAYRLLKEPKPRRHDFSDIDEYIGAHTAWLKSRSAAAGIIESADNRLERVHVREAKLFGLDAPTEAKLEVTNVDAVQLELSAMLERAAKVEK